MSETDEPSPDTPDPATARARELWNQARHELTAGNGEAARSAARRLVALLEPATDATRPTYASALGLQTSIEARFGDPGAAGRLIPAALGRLTPAAPPWRRAELLAVQALTLADDDRKADAVSVGEEALELFGDDGPAEMRFFVERMLADALNDLSRYDEALAHHEFRVKTAREWFGDESEEYATALSGHGLALDQTGEWGSAERRYREAQHIFEHEDPEHPMAFIMRGNVAELARVRGDLTYAEREFRTLTQLDARRHPRAVDRNVRVLVQFGLTLAGMGRFAEAETVLEEARALRAETVGLRAPAYARVLLALAQLQLLQQHDEAAIDWYDQTIAAYGTGASQADDVLNARFEQALARISVSDNPAAAVVEARALLRQASADGEEGHPDALTMRWSLIARLDRHRRDDDLRALLSEDDSYARLHLGDVLSTSSEAAAADTLARFQGTERLALRLLVAAPHPPSAEEVARAYTTARGSRGIATRVLRWRSIRRLTESVGPARAEVARLTEEVVRLRVGPTDDTGVGAELTAAENRLAAVETELAGRTVTDRTYWELMAESSLPLQLPARTALLLYAVADRLDGSDARYLVFVDRGNDAPVMLLDLADRSAVDQLVMQYRDGVVSQGRTARPNTAAWREPGLELSRLLIDPVRAALAGDGGAAAVDHLWILPDGRLGVLPFGALPTTDGFLVDEFAFTYRSWVGTFEGVLFEGDTGVGEAPVVIGAPAYTSPGRSPAPTPESASASASEGDSDFLDQFRSGGRFSPLPAADAECRTIARLLGVPPLLAENANEAAMFALSSPEVLHVATHGFFLAPPDPAVPAAPDVAAEPGVAGPIVAGMPPADHMNGRLRLAESLDRAGLAFAGANDYLDGRALPPDADDGILYASEVAGLDLTHTDLVTISACQTGLGDVRSGDGVRGLQRAFVTAGARSVVCSLWEVPDEPTRALFVDFYQRIFAGEPRGTAFQASVTTLRRQYPQHPVAWGGFVLSGDDRTLTRFDSVRSLRVATFTWPGGDDDEDSGAVDLSALFAEGVELLQGGQGAEAAAVYSTMLDHVDDSAGRAQVLVNRAWAYAMAGSYDLAQADFTAVADDTDAPGDQRARALTGRYQLQRDHDDGPDTGDLDRVVACDEADPDTRAGAYLLLGDRAHHDGRLEDAARDFRAAGAVEGVSDEIAEQAADLLARLEHTE